jgi:hypothetical protein
MMDIPSIINLAVWLEIAGSFPQDLTMQKCPTPASHQETKAHGECDCDYPLHDR